MRYNAIKKKKIYMYKMGRSRSRKLKMSRRTMLGLGAMGLAAYAASRSDKFKEMFEQRFFYSIN